MLRLLIFSHSFVSGSPVLGAPYDGLLKSECYFFFIFLSSLFSQVITLCERLAGQDANVTTVPVAVLRFTRQLTRFFQWTNDVADRLAFSEVTTMEYGFTRNSVLVTYIRASEIYIIFINQVLSSDTVFSAPMNETYQLLGVDAKDILSLEKYLQEYFTNILKKLKGLKAQSKQTDIFF
jgi:hypothetical protein